MTICTPALRSIATVVLTRHWPSPAGAGQCEDSSLIRVKLRDEFSSSKHAAGLDQFDADRGKQHAHGDRTDRLRTSSPFYKARINPLLIGKTADTYPPVDSGGPCTGVAKSGKFKGKSCAAAWCCVANEDGEEAAHLWCAQLNGCRRGQHLHVSTASCPARCAAIMEDHG